MPKTSRVSRGRSNTPTTKALTHIVVTRPALTDGMKTFITFLPLGSTSRLPCCDGVCSRARSTSSQIWS